MFAMCMPGEQRPEKGVRAARIGITGHCEPLCGCWGPT